LKVSAGHRKIRPIQRHEPEHELCLTELVQFAGSLRIRQRPFAQHAPGHKILVLDRQDPGTEECVAPPIVEWVAVSVRTVER
jgi:hypothetical protein